MEDIQRLHEERNQAVRERQEAVRQRNAEIRRNEALERRIQELEARRRQKTPELDMCGRDGVRIFNLNGQSFLLH